MKDFDMGGISMIHHSIDCTFIINWNEISTTKKRLKQRLNLHKLHCIGTHYIMLLVIASSQLAAPTERDHLLV